VGDLAADTAVAGGEGRYTATPNEDWNIWGPNGGYVASIALRAAMAATELERPASLTCQYLRPARFEEVQLEVRSLRRSKRAECLAVSMTQDGEPVLEAQVWASIEQDAIEHQHAPMWREGPASAYPTIEERFEEAGIEPGQPPFVFWNNFEHRPTDFLARWEDREAGEPEAGGWYRYAPTPTFDDPVVDACRALILADTFTWPAVTRAHAGQIPFIAPSLDLWVSFHHDIRDSEWLLVEGEAPVAHRGTIACRSQVWSEDGRLAASGSGTLLCIPVR
jgi:acyl-CoA thioesterase-2